MRRERPRPGAQLSLSDLDEGMRHRVFLTDTPLRRRLRAAPGGVRHRAHARVEDRILHAKTTGFDRFHIDVARLQLALTAVDLLVWPQGPT